MFYIILIVISRQFFYCMIYYPLFAAVSNYRHVNVICRISTRSGSKLALIQFFAYRFIILFSFSIFPSNVVVFSYKGNFTFLSQCFGPVSWMLRCLFYKQNTCIYFFSTCLLDVVVFVLQTQHQYLFFSLAREYIGLLRRY